MTLEIDGGKDIRTKDKGNLSGGKRRREKKKDVQLAQRW